MPKIILVSGKAQHGKDAFSERLRKELAKKGKSVHVVHYADALKGIAEYFYGWDGEKDKKGRSLLQRLGTENGRKVNENFWVEMLANILKLEPFCSSDYLIISDCRFPNEINYWDSSDYPHYSVRMTRLNFSSNLTEEQKNHPSETALDNYSFDFEVETESLNETYHAAKLFSQMLIKGDL